MSQALQSLKCCLNPKVLIALAAAGVAVVLLAPNLIASAFPLLLALVCPLSMLVMMGSMARMGTNKQNAQTSAPNVLTSAEAPVPGLALPALDTAETAAQLPNRALRQAERVAALADSHAAREHA